MRDLRDNEIKQKVRETYGKIATGDASGCGCDCYPSALGYAEADIRDVPVGAATTLGSGNPLSVAVLRLGETVLDLGSGIGLDCFIAAKQVGETGRVIGVDMTPEMVNKARKNAETGGYTNVEFHFGEIEHLPVADASVDVIVSNCVINLSRDKLGVYRDAYRPLRAGGRLAISDVVATAELPEDARNDLALYTACISGAATVAELRRILREVGFERIRIRPNDENRKIIDQWLPGRSLADYVISASIEAVKPGD